MAQTQVSNTAQVAVPDGVIDTVPGNNSSTAVVDVYTVALAKTADPASGTPVAIGATLQYTVTATISGGATTTEPVVVTDTLGTGLDFVTPLPAGCTADQQVLTCTIAAGATGTASITYSATVTADAGTSVGNSVTGGDSCSASCTTTHPVYRGVTLTKAWANGAAGDSVTLTIGGTDVTGATAGSSAVGGATTPATAIAAAGATVELGETFAPAGAAANYTTSFACQDGSGDPVAVSGSGQGASFVMPTDATVACTATNTRIQTTLQLVKQWQGGRAGDTATVVADGFTNDASSGLSTSTGNDPDTTTGVAVVVFAGESGTLSETLSAPGDYVATLACTGNTVPLAGNTLTIAPGDPAIVCTQTNTRRQANLTLRKTWTNAAVGEAATVTATGSETGQVELASAADTASETDTAGPFTVYAGETLAFAESFDVAANAANYGSELVCTGAANWSAGSTSFQVADGDSDIQCTYTNTRRQARLRLEKAWGDNSRIGDAAQLAPTTGLLNNTAPLAVTADIGGVTPFVTVYAGEVATLPAETMSGDALANYGVVVACTGGSLGGTDGKAANTLEILPADEGSDIVCTYTNNPIATTLQLQKVWLNAIPGDQVTLLATGLPGFPSTASGGATQTDTSIATDVYAGQVINLTESFTTSALPYDSTLACTNTAPPTNNSGTTGTITIGPDDGPILCTFTNDRKSAQLVVQKVWAGGGPPATVTIGPSTGFANNNPQLVSTSPTAGQTDAVEVFVLEEGQLPAEQFTSGDPANYDSTVACDGTDTDPSNGLQIPLADAGATITCTYSNTFVKRAELSVDKTVTSAPPTNDIVAGSVIQYQVTVTNTGNVPVTGVDVADDLVGNLSCTPAEPLDLDVGESTTCTASYTITQEDIDRVAGGNGIDGSISNTATADGTDPDDVPVHGEDGTDTPLPPNEFEFGFTKDAQLADSDGSLAGSVGETISYTFSITNEGNTSITIDTLVDSMLPGLACSPLPYGPVPPGGTVDFGPAAPADVVCTGLSHTITQADIDNQGTPAGSGEIQNTATASGGNESRDATDNVPLDPPQPQIQLDKTASPTNVDGAGDVITYTFVVTNPGNVTVTGITVTDPMAGLGPITCTPTAPFDLAPGGSATCQAQYTVTQADIDAGTDITNTASADGSYDGDPVDDQDDAAVDVDTGPAQPELLKFATPSAVTAAGETVTFTFQVNNPSQRTLLNLQIIADPLLPDLACDTIPSLAPGDSASFNCTAGNTYVVTQSDIDNQGNPTVDSGVLVNTATGQAEYVDDGQTVVATDDASASVDLPPRAPSIFLTKGSDVTSVTEAGDPIAYSFNVLNNGNVTLTNVRISDPLLAGLTCPPLASLAPGEDVDFTCTGNSNVYTVTQADIDTNGDGGQIVNVATTIADTPETGVTASDDDQHEVDLPVRRADMTLDKTASVASISAPVTVQYQFEVENTGNVTITDLVVADATLGMTCPVIPELLPGQSLTLGPAGSDVVCTDTQRVVDQDDIDTLASIDNTATATGQTEVSGTITRDDSVSLPVNRNPGLDFSKSANVASVTAPGDPVVYTLTGTNSGNVTLQNVAITDPLLASPPGGVALSCTPASPIAALAPGEGFSCTGTYPAQQSDFDDNGGGDGYIDNTATAAWDGGSAGSSARVQLPTLSQSLLLEKTAGTPTTAGGIDPAVTDAGDTIPYTFEVTNTGNQTVSALQIVDANLDDPATCDATVLAAGEVTTCTGTHTITQAEMDSGVVNNTANARGQPPGSQPEVTSDQDTAQVLLGVEPAISLDKEAGAPTTAGGALPAVTDAGDTIAYTFEVTNTGNVTLRDVTVTDPLPGLGGISCPTGQVAPGASVTCSSATHTITQAEMDAGLVENTATATGIVPSGGTVDGDDSTQTPLAAVPAITLDKSASTPTYATAGQTITYSYLVTNTGNVSVSTLQVSDDLIATVTCPVTDLAPGANTTCTGTYVITVDDLDTGSVTNNAEATATPSQGTLAPATDTETITANQAPSLSLVKTATPTTVSTVGETVTYSFAVTNSGNVTIDTLSITETAFSGTGTAPVISCPVTELAPGVDTTCTGTYAVTQADLDAGQVTNTATANGLDPGDAAVASAPDDATVTVNENAELTLVKTATPTTVSTVGETVTYSFAVTNSGNVTIDTLSITETAFSGTGTAPVISCPVTELAPGADTTCTGTYAVTQADLDAGQVTNTATANGLDPGDAAVASAPDDATVTVNENAELTLVKTATPTTVSTVGETVTYSFAVTNSGNVTIDTLSITETAFSGSGTAPVISCPVTELAPGVDTTCTGTYAVTQADLDAGQVTNTATANGADPGGTAVASDLDDALVNAEQAPGLALDKSTSSTGYDSVGDLLQYSYLVTNSGNVTLTSPISVDDDRIVAPNSVNCPALPAGGLAPGDSITCTATHVVTQADLDAGSVTNIATASDGSNVSPPDSETVDGTQTPAIVLDKTASLADTNGDGVVGDAGDTITYAFSVENTGNVVLAPVTVTDPLLPGLSCTIATLAPGDTAVCTATGNTYVITTADEANGSVDNTATATGDAPGNAPDATAQDTLSTPTQLTPAATTVAKSADPAPGTEVAPGDTITYTVTVTVADASLHEPVTLTDTLGDGLSFAAVTSAGAFTCNAANPLVCTLPAGTAPGAYPLAYTATVDADASGEVGNSVVATKPAGTDPDPVCGTCDTNHPVVASTSTVSKSSSPASNIPVNPGTTITFTLTTVVSGSITTEPVTLVDTMDPGLTFVAVTDPGAYSCSGALTCVLPADTLPGSYDIVYTATVDADASGVLNNVVVPSNLPDPGRDPDPVCQGSCATVHPVSRPAIELEKEVTGNDDADGNGEVSVGDTLTYTVTATNTGNVPLANVTIVDPLVDPDSITCALVAPGGQCRLVGTYTVVQADADAGQVLNEATVTTEAPPDVPPLPPEACPAGSTDEACTADNVTPVIQRPAIATTKAAVLSVDGATPGKGNIGDVITYSVNATNSGNVTLNGVTVSDSFQDGTPVTLACAPTTLAPGQVATCDSYDHTITEDDVRVEDGLLVNTVLAQGDAGVVSGTVQVTANALAQVEVQNEPAQLYLVKTVAVREVNIGDLVRYTLTLENTGDIDLVDGYIIDTPALGFTYVEGSLAGDDDDHSVVASGSSPLRVSDIDIAAGHTATMSYLMRVGAGVRPGVQVNRAIAYDPAYDGPASNEATAEVVLGSDPLLDESLISGTVFGDRDGDAWQDSAALTGVRVQGGFAPGAYVAGSTTVDRGDGPQAEPDASAPLLHGIALGRVDGRQSQADPSSAHQVVISQRLDELAFTGDFVLTSEQGATVRMAADGSTTTETRGDAAKGLTAAAPTVQRQVAQTADGYRIDYVVRNEGIDERGIPGVRIASVEGLLVETDQYGRYHLVGIDAGKAARGRNFILKVDTATLPPGAELTTENPKLRRITGGVPTRFDFGVRLPEQVIQGRRQVEMALGTIVFTPGSAQVQPRYLPVIDSMADQVRSNGAGEVVISADGETEALALARASAVRALLDERLDESLRPQVTLSVRADPDDPASLLAGIGEGGPVLGTLLFDTDKATIQPRFDALLDQVARLLADSGGESVAIIGHADRRGSREYNAALGLRRAKAVYEALAPRLPPDVRARLTVEIAPDPDAPLQPPPAGEGTP